jgi:hypothetical protein
LFVAVAIAGVGFPRTSCPEGSNTISWTDGDSPHIRPRQEYLECSL